MSPATTTSIYLAGTSLETKPSRKNNVTTNMPEKAQSNQCEGVLPAAELKSGNGKTSNKRRIESLETKTPCNKRMTNVRVTWVTNFPTHPSVKPPEATLSGSRAQAKSFASPGLLVLLTPSSLKVSSIANRTRRS